MIDEDEMDLPPGWLGFQAVVANSSGNVPEQEQDVFCHFCSHTCLIEYVAGDKMRARICLSEKKDESSTDTENDPEENDY